MLKQQVLELVRAKSGGVVITREIMEVSIDEIEQGIRNYCHIRHIPEAARFIWANMALDLAMYYHHAMGGESGKTETALGIDSIKIGDTSIKLGVSSSANPEVAAVKSHVPRLDALILNYREQLQAFRKVAR